ncbi:MAG: right-handed parallel beta-helix repeat-containing protein [Clostridia bacterium]|nr:right-handed parallel beta-helix repeat-containing protein [Clostridia bacterium]
MKRIISAMMSVLFVFCAFSILSGCTGESEGGDDTTASSGKTPAEEKGNVMYVSADAEEGGDGSAEKPFSTIIEARDGIRGIKQGEGLPDGGITVLISGGTYRITEPIELLAEDSGEKGKQITYKALDGAEVVIDGGVQLKGELFEPANEEFKSRLLSDEAKSKLLQIDLSAAGCYDLDYVESYGWGGAIIYKNIQELYADGKRQRIAQWPNFGEPYASSVVVKRDTYDHPDGYTLRANYLEIPEGRAAAWEGDNILICGLFANDWETALTGSTWNGVDVENNLLMTCSSLNPTPDYGFNEGRPYYVFNIPADLDVPGEYFWDSSNNMLYYYPTGDVNEMEITFSQIKEYLIHGTDLSYVSFDGLTFKHSRGSGITCGLSGENNVPTKGIEVTNCTFTELGGCALVLHDVVDTKVDSNEFYELGCAGIEVTNQNFADRHPSNNYIQNNLVHDWAQYYPTENPGITARGMGFYIGHNELYNAPHTGILFMCGDSIVECNIIHDTSWMSGDAGAIYNGGSWARTGNVIRYNYIYNVRFEYNGLKANGLYLDDQLPGQVVYGNTIKNTGGTGISVSGGKNCIVTGNVLIDMPSVPININDNGITFQAESTKYSPEYPGYWGSVHNMDYTGEFIRDMYPELTLINEVVYYSGDIDDPGSQSYEKFENNIVYGIEERSEIISPDEIGVKGYEKMTIDGVVLAGGQGHLFGSIRNNMIYEIDPGFEKIGKVDDALSPDSQVYRDFYNFEPIPYETIGIQERSAK